MSASSGPSPHTDDRPLELSAIALTVLLSAIWGGAFVAIKVGIFDMPPLGAAALRFGVTAVMLLALAWYQRVQLRFGWSELKILGLLGLLFCYGNMAVYLGTALTTSGRSAVFFSAQPIFIALLAPFFLPGDRLTARKVCGLAVAFSGIVVLFSAKFGGGLSDALIGDAIVLSSALTIGISGIITKRVAGRVHPVALVCWQTWITWPILTLFSWMFEADQPFLLSTRVIVSIVYLSAISAAFGFVAYAWLIQRHSPTRVASLTFLTPVFAVLFGWLLLNEHMGVVQLLGVAGVCVGIYIVNSSGTSPSPTAEQVRSVGSIGSLGLLSLNPTDSTDPMTLVDSTDAKRRPAGYMES